MSHLTQKPKIFFGLLMLVVKWESLLTRVMAAYGGLVFGRTLLGVRKDMCRKDTYKVYLGTKIE